MAVFIKKVNIPQKSDLINIDMTGSGTAQTYRVLKNVSGSVVEVMSMSDDLTSTFATSGQVYKNSTLDNYINSTWYETLSNTAKSAIIDKTFRQDNWYVGTQGNPDYEGKKYDNSSYQMSLNTATFDVSITRHVYTLSVQDIIDYLEVTPSMTQANTTLTANNIYTMLWNSTSQQSSKYVWLSSASGNMSSIVLNFSGYEGSIGGVYPSNNNIVRPLLQIDLSKIDFTYVESKPLYILQPASTLQKINNALSRVGMSYKEPAAYPVKSDIVNIDMTGSGTPQQYRILKINGSVAEVISMETGLTATFGNSNTYQNSTLDTYLNSTWYDTLSNTAKQAIVDKTFRQDSWYGNTSGSPIYNGTRSNGTYEVSFGSASFGNEITRHCYAISVQDIIDYLEVIPQMTYENTTLNYNNVWEAFWKTGIAKTETIWCRSAEASGTSDVMTIAGLRGRISYLGGSNETTTHPAFQIDLSKIEFTIQP